MARYSKKSQEFVKEKMHEYKEGEPGGARGTKIKSPEQAIAIGLSEARKAGAKVPPAPKRSTKRK